MCCLTGENIDQARERIVEIAKTLEAERSTIVGDIISHGEIVLLVVPIDLGAPKGRLILPQVQVIRDILDNDAAAVTVKEREIEYVLSSLKTPPGLVICDSQVVLKVAGDLPPILQTHHLFHPVLQAQGRSGYIRTGREGHRHPQRR